MPIYEYVCASCGLEFEAIQKFSDEPLTECTCGQSGRVERKLSLSAFQLKGGGWYKDLYGGGKSNGAASTGKPGDSKSGGTGESKPAESKAEGASTAGSASEGTKAAGAGAKAASPAAPSA
jgi:putative FmdB family regulatory protein